MVPAIDTSKLMVLSDSEVAGIYARRLQRCAQIRTSWSLYLKLNIAWATLLNRVSEQSNRDCLQLGIAPRVGQIADSGQDRVPHGGEED